MKIYLHKLTALKIIAVFFNGNWNARKCFNKKAWDLLLQRRLQKRSFQTPQFQKTKRRVHPRLLHKEADWKLGLLFASCAVFADRLVGKHRTLVAYNVLSRLKVHKYWSKKIFKLPRIKFFPHWFALPAWGKSSEVTRICILFECC